MATGVYSRDAWLVGSIHFHLFALVNLLLGFQPTLSPEMRIATLMTQVLSYYMHRMISSLSLPPPVIHRKTESPASYIEYVAILAGT